MREGIQRHRDDDQLEKDRKTAHEVYPGIHQDAALLLLLITRQPNKVHSQSELVDATGFTQTYVSSWCEKLYEVGWVTREAAHGGDPGGGPGIGYRLKPPDPPR